MSTNRIGWLLVAAGFCFQPVARSTAVALGLMVRCCEHASYSIRCRHGQRPTSRSCRCPFSPGAAENLATSFSNSILGTVARESSESKVRSAVVAGFSEGNESSKSILITFVLLGAVAGASVVATSAVGTGADGATGFASGCVAGCVAGCANRLSRCLRCNRLFRLLRLNYESAGRLRLRGLIRIRCNDDSDEGGSDEFGSVHGDPCRMKDDATVHSLPVGRQSNLEVAGVHELRLLAIARDDRTRYAEVNRLEESDYSLPPMHVIDATPPFRERHQTYSRYNRLGFTLTFAIKANCD